MTDLDRLKATFDAIGVVYNEIRHPKLPDYVGIALPRPNAPDFIVAVFDEDGNTLSQLPPDILFPSTE